MFRVLLLSALTLLSKRTLLKKQREYFKTLLMEREYIAQYGYQKVTGKEFSYPGSELSL